MPEPESYPFPALGAQLAAEGRRAERDAAAWDLADRIARLGHSGFKSRPAAGRVAHPAAAIPVIEAN